MTRAITDTRPVYARLQPAMKRRQKVEDSMREG